MKSVFRLLQKTENTTLNQTRLLLNQFIENFARFFILLLFAAGVFTIIRKLFPTPNQYLPDGQYAYLHCCEIKI
ncbi:MAG TPA: hypothetical protein VGM63_08765 [Mucilaginibacter sp.]